MHWFDAHLDMACLAELDRDFTKPTEDAGGPQPAAVTFPALAEGNIRWCCATIFVQPRVLDGPLEQRINGDWCYGNIEEAHRACLRQISIYQQWQSEGHIGICGTAGAKADAPLQALLLLEGAAGIRHEEDLRLFYQSGVRIIGLTWAPGSQYAGGDRTGEDLTPAGRNMLLAIDKLNMVHDVSHLSEKAFWSVMQRASGPKIASHSNCRSLLPDAPVPERHLSDGQIKAIFQAGGVIGINLYSKFLARGRRATVADVVKHIEHMADIAGRFDCIGLGSDMDGGFTPDDLPEQLEHPRHLPRLAAALSDAGFSDEDIQNFASATWRDYFGRRLRLPGQAGAGLMAHKV